MLKKISKKTSFKKLTIIILYIVFHVNGNEKNNSLIYILMWTTSKLSPLVYMEMEQQYFIKHKCPYQNCFITDNKLYFNNVTDYEVILFNAVNVTDLERPLERTEKQIYVFVSDEPPIYYPVPPYYNGFFNWTWTYKLDSDANLRYLIVKNKKGEVIGPKLNMYWMKVSDMKPVSKIIKRKLRNKNKAVAWFVSHCETPNHREVYARSLSNELGKFKLEVDIYGQCGYLKCPKENITECYAMLASDYYFYLSFENSMGEDYVTEKLLTPLQHYVVPVVYGGANYTRHVLYQCTSNLKSVSLGLT